MKRSLAVLLIGALLLSLCGCTDKPAGNDPTSAPTAAATPTAEPVDSVTPEPTSEPTPTEKPTPTPTPTESPRLLSFDLDATHQTIDGFGAGFTWYSNELFRLPNFQQPLDLLFKDAGFTILRFKNEYGYSTDAAFAGGAANNKRYYEAAKKYADERGEDITVLYSSWSPPASLKSNNSINGGGTLKKDDDGNYVYPDFAKWWSDSVAAYREAGVPVDVISIQNECDFTASYDGCEFGIDESSLASYPTAYLTTYREMTDRFGEDAPHMIAPETMTVDSNILKMYLRAIRAEEPDSIYAIAHHLYLGGTSSEDPNSCAPDSFLMNFRSVSSMANEYGLRKWQTEFYRGTALQTAGIINNSLIYENANAYIFWGGVWTGTVNDDIDNGSLILIGQLYRSGVDKRGYKVTGNYYAMRHFSQFIRPGFIRIDFSLSGSSSVRMSAYKSPDADRVVIVLLNNGTEPEQVILSLDNYDVTASQSYCSVFTEGYTEDMLYQDTGAIPADNTVTLPGESVMTIVLDGKAR